MILFDQRSCSECRHLEGLNCKKYHNIIGEPRFVAHLRSDGDMCGPEARGFEYRLKAIIIEFPQAHRVSA